MKNSREELKSKSEGSFQKVNQKDKEKKIQKKNDKQKRFNIQIRDKEREE